MTNSTPYQAKILCFLDLLGFRNHVMTDDSEALISLISGLRAGHGIARQDGYIGKAHESYSFQFFSDSIVLTIDPNEKCLSDIILQVCRLQMSLAYRRILLRGAITCGGYFKEDDILLSPALVRAYQLESTVAKYPRVILDSESKELKGILESPSDFLARHVFSEDLATDQDSLVFVGYQGTDPSFPGQTGGPFAGIRL